MDRQANRKLNKAEQDAFKEVLESWPVSVIVPTGSKCNLQCVFCTERGKTTIDQYQNLSFGTFLNYTNSLEFASSVGLYGWGEPFVNPHYVQIFEYVKDKFDGIEIHISTNGLLLTHEWIDRLISYRYSVVNISLNAATRRTFTLLTKNRNFGKIVRNIDLLVEARGNRSRQSPFISLSFLVLKQNIHELPAFVELAAQLGVDCVLLLDLIILEDRHYHYSLEGMEAETQECLLRAEELSKRNGVKLISFTKTSCFREDTGTQCFDPWESFKICMNGDVNICCYSKTTAGNLLQASVREIWNGEVYRYFRRTVNTNNPPFDCLSCPRKKRKRR